MDFSRLYLLLRLPLAVLICSQLVSLGGDFPPDDYLISPDEVAYTFDERDDNKPFDVGLPVVNFKDALIQHSNWVSLDLGYVSKSATLELRATGPPNA
jgi:hypothetical protein